MAEHAGPLRGEEETVDLSQTFGVQGSDLVATRHEVVELFELGQTDGCGDIRHAVVEPDFREPVPSIGVHALAAKQPGVSRDQDRDRDPGLDPSQ